MIFQLVYGGSAVTQQPLSQALSSAKATRREESHRVQVHGSVKEAKKKKKVMKAVAVIYAKCCERPQGGKGVLLGGTSTSRLGQVSYREKVNYVTWALKT